MLGGCRFGGAFAGKRADFEPGAICTKKWIKLW